MSDIQEYIVKMNSLMYSITIKVNWPGHRQTGNGRVKKSLILSRITEKYGGKKVIMHDQRKSIVEERIASVCWEWVGQGRCMGMVQHVVSKCTDINGP